MIKKYISKFTIDILPSIIATIVGAYIVTHYINPKSDGDKPASAMASTVDAKPDAKAPAAKPAETSADVVDAPAATIRGKADKPVVEKAGTDKSDKPDTASAPEPRRHQPAIRDKAVAKATPAPVVTPPVATVSIAPAEAAPTLEERRDANDLARAAIERLRNSKESQEATKAPETPRVADAPRVAAAPVMQQLPPPITVSTPSIETFNPPPSRQVSAEDRPFDPRRPRPPGEIPLAQPLDIQADASGPALPERRTNVAEDVLSAAKSVFHSVIPRRFEQ
jgi:hypothetical protein